MVDRAKHPRRLAASRDTPVDLPEVRSIVRGVVRRFGFYEPEIQEELIQDALVRIVVSVRTGRFRGDSSLETYSYSVAKFTCLNYLRTRRLEARLGAEPTLAAVRLSGPEEALLRREEHRENLRAFLSLSPECRRLFRWVFVEELSYREVASRLGVSEGTIKSRVHRCRAAGRGGRSSTRRSSRLQAGPPSRGI